MYNTILLSFKKIQYYRFFLSEPIFSLTSKISQFLNYSEINLNKLYLSSINNLKKEFIFFILFYGSKKLNLNLDLYFYNLNLSGVEYINYLKIKLLFKNSIYIKRLSIYEEYFIIFTEERNYKIYYSNIYNNELRDVTNSELSEEFYFNLH